VTEVRERRALNRAIPDTDVTGISDVVTVARAGVARAVSVDIDIVHTYIGDLRVELVAPSGARALLHNRTGGSTADLKRTFTSADTAELAALVSQPIQGEMTRFAALHEMGVRFIDFLEAVSSQ
jgi:subtilisin-like proprotein convertase family protein